MRLARLGHLQGLKAAVEAALVSHAECAPELRRLAELVERYDLDGVLHQLVKNLQGRSAEEEEFSL